MKTCYLFQEKKKREKGKGKKHYYALLKLYHALRRIRDFGKALAACIILYIRLHIRLCHTKESINSRVKLSIRDKEVSTVLLLVFVT